MSFLFSRSLFFFFFFFFSFSTMVPYSSFWMTLSLGRADPSLTSNFINCYISLLQLQPSSPIQNKMKKNMFIQYFSSDSNHSENRLTGDLGEMSFKKMTEVLPEDFEMSRICNKHSSKITAICLAPCCDNYKELCPLCEDGHGHPSFIRKWPEAVEEAKRLLKNCLSQLQVIRRRKQDDYQKHLQHNMMLCSIEKNLQNIQQIIVGKIRTFKESIKTIYSQDVNAKLNELDQIMLTSYKALQEELSHIRQKPNQCLSHIFSRDLEYEVKYYDSHFNEIFVNKTRNFKNLDDDRIMALIVTFEQNLNKIFNYKVQKGKETPDCKQYHVFKNEGSNNLLYTLSKDWKNIEITELPDKKQLAHLEEKQKYQWEGVPQSIYYKPKNCYYIIGEGKKISKSIVKWDCNKPLTLPDKASEFLEDAFIPLRPMETERRQFAVCELGGEIYIVGGQNQKEGCLARCQKVVPQYNSQIYLIHSLNCKSSRHSLTTYKNKYILKFGGIKTMWPQDNIIQSLEHIAAPPQIYSTQTEEWSIIPVSRDLQQKFGLYPPIFKSENKNTLLILGGQYCKEPSSINVAIEDSKGVVEELKIRTNKSGVSHRGVIFNNSIRVDEEQNVCVFLTIPYGGEQITLERKRMFHGYH